MGAVFAGRAHAASRSGGSRGVCRHRRRSTRRRILCARCSRAWPIRLQDTFTLFAELGIPVSGIRLGGGGARGALWRKIQAGIYGHAVEVLTAEEGGAFGCALMAGVGVGHWGIWMKHASGDRSSAADRARARDGRPTRSAMRNGGNSIRRCEAFAKLGS